MENKKMSESKTLYSGKYLNLVERDGWEYITRNTKDVVVIFPIIKDPKTNKISKIVLIKEFRKPFQKYVIGLPAGLVGDLEEHESIYTAADRELLEETGYKAWSLSNVLRDLPSSSGMSDETFNLIIARELEKIHDGGGDDSEDIEVIEVDIETIDSFLFECWKEGHLIDPKIYIGLYMILNERYSDLMEWVKCSKT